MYEILGTSEVSFVSSLPQQDTQRFLEWYFVLYDSVCGGWWLVWPPSPLSHVIAHFPLDIGDALLMDWHYYFWMCLCGLRCCFSSSLDTTTTTDVLPTSIVFWQYDLYRFALYLLRSRVGGPGVPTRPPPWSQPPSPPRRIHGGNPSSASTLALLVGLANNKCRGGGFGAHEQQQQ